jgi:FKBP-type peptidyl-prolyl cis-trans isomerase
MLARSWCIQLLSIMLWRIAFLFTASSSSSAAMIPPCSRRHCLSQVLSSAAGTLLASTPVMASEGRAAEPFRTVVVEPPVDCRMRSQRGDILEIIYEAHLYSKQGPVYDSSIQRGTGQPYQMVLGSGDMLPGVDLGLYDMCPGEVRALFLPPSLAYGQRGNRLYRIPPDTPLYWKVQLIAIQSVQRQEDEE